MAGTIDEVVESAAEAEGELVMALPPHLPLEIVTPERAHRRTSDVDEVQIPGAEGYFGVLPGHTPLLAALQVGQLWYRQGQEKRLSRRSPSASRRCCRTA